jgi:adenylate cyclase
MSLQVNGQLNPVGGGDPIPLIRERLVVGRRESCDIPLHRPNVSGLHCELTFRKGFWWIRDMGSTNGIKVNGSRVTEKRLLPEDTITIAKKHWTINYVLPINQALEEMLEEEEEDVMGTSLLEKAGIVRRGPALKRVDPEEKLAAEEDEDEDD